MNTIKTVVSAAATIVIAALLVGCSAPTRPEAHAAPAPASGPCQKPHRVVVGIDRSGSYSLTQTGQEVVARLIESSACPGDVWLLRWLQTSSYPVDAALRTLTFMPLPAKPAQPKNPMLRKPFFQAQAAWGAKAKAFADQKIAAATKLRAEAPEPSDGTDIVGFLLKADEILANTPAGTDPIIVLTSDLEDNAGHTGAFNLHGAAVLALAFEGDDPEVSRPLRDAWRARLTAAGARTVVFRDATEPGANLNLLTDTPPDS